MSLFGGIACWVLSAYQLVVLVYIIAAWIPSPPEGLRPLLRGARSLVDPVILPLRRRLSPVRVGAVALDSSILVLIIALVLLQAVFC